MIIDLNNLVINLNENNFKTLAIAKAKNNETGVEKEVIKIDFLDKTSMFIESPIKTPEATLELLKQIKEGLKNNLKYLKLSTFPKIENK